MTLFTQKDGAYFYFCRVVRDLLGYSLRRRSPWNSIKSSRIRLAHCSSTDGGIWPIRPSLESWDSHLSNGGGLDPGDDSHGILWANRNGEELPSQNTNTFLANSFGPQLVVRLLDLINSSTTRKLGSPSLDWRWCHSRNAFPRRIMRKSNW